MLQTFYSKLAETYRLRCIDSLLNWDQQVNLPTHAAEERAEQIELVAKLLHQKSVDPVFLDLVDTLHERLKEYSEDDQVNIRETKRLLDRQRKLPESFVAERSRFASVAYNVWIQARPNNDFLSVRPHLQRIVELCRQEAMLVGFEQSPYDALLEIYEPGAQISFVKPLLLRTAEALRTMLPQLTEAFAAVPALRGNFPKVQQQELNAKIVQAVGFDFQSGRIDTAVHPFQSSLGMQDARITTRYDQSNFLSALFGSLHETGHALYELGFEKKHSGTPMASAVSLAIHESQSRLWENIVGRSEEFVSFLYSLLSSYFPKYVKSTSQELLWQQANKIQPSLIRVEADEVSYSLHIVIRTLLEESLVAGDLCVNDLPGAWNDLYERYLGLRPKNDAEGVLQDVHWYSGSIGYFPTYALGNLYGAMMIEAAEKELGCLSQLVAEKRFADLLQWLRRNVHLHGMKYRGPELIERISGSPLSELAFLNYLKQKFRAFGV